MINKKQHDKMYYSIKTIPFFNKLVLHIEDSTLQIEDDTLKDKQINYNLFVTDLSNSKTFAIFYNYSIINKNEINQLKLENCIINKISLNTKHVCLFNFENEWYIVYHTNLEKLIININNDQKKSPITEIFKKHTNCKNLFDTLNKTYSYHFLIRDNSFKKFNSVTDIAEPLTFLWAHDENLKLVDIELPQIYNEKKYNFLCHNELETSINTIESTDMTNRILTFGGYFIRLLSKDKTKCICFVIQTDLYKNILFIFNKYDNKYFGYIELYQNNLLKDMLPYLHKYPANVIKRINTTIKIFSKEILNIYHATRKKQNSLLYDNLPQSYKKILYVLHKIYVTQKYEEYTVKSDNILKEKISITIDIVYKYIKGMDVNDLFMIFKERKKLFKILNEIKFDYDDLLIDDNIDVAIQYELMNMN